MDATTQPLRIKDMMQCQRCRQRPIKVRKSALCGACYMHDYNKIARPNRRLLKVLDRIDKLNAELIDAKECANLLLQQIETARAAKQKWENWF